MRLGSGSRELAPMQSTEEKLRRCVNAVDVTIDIFRGFKTGTTKSTLLWASVRLVVTTGSWKFSIRFVVNWKDTNLYSCLCSKVLSQSGNSHVIRAAAFEAGADSNKFIPSPNTDGSLRLFAAGPG